MDASVKRIRVFSGPNGSGKSTLFDLLASRFSAAGRINDLGVFINADKIEYQLVQKGFFDFQEYSINPTLEEWHTFLTLESSVSITEKALISGQAMSFSFIDGFIVNRDKDANSYVASLIAAFLRWKLVKQEQSFCFESVMSHPSKFAELEDLHAQGYRIYLYFVCLAAPQLNISRVKARKEKGGHDVSADKIEKRYNEVLRQINRAIPFTYRAYFIDNTGDKMRVVAELQMGKPRLPIDSDTIPTWFKTHILPHLQ